MNVDPVNTSVTESEPSARGAAASRLPAPQEGVIVRADHGGVQASEKPSSGEHAGDRGEDSVHLEDRVSKARELAIRYLRDVIDPDPVDGRWPKESAKAAESTPVESPKDEKAWYEDNRGSLDIVA
jgi:hypothetical protein